MKKLIRKITLSFATLAVLLLVFVVGAKTAPSAYAAAYTASVNGNWSNVATWGGAGVPGSVGTGDTVNINSGITVTLDASPAFSIASLTMNAPAANNALNWGGAFTLTVTGAVTMNAPTAGVITSTISVGTGTLDAASVAIPGSGTANRFCTLSVSTGTINVTGNITFSGTAAQARLTFSGAGTLNIGGDLGSGGTFTASTGTVNFNGAAQSVGRYTYNNLTLSGSDAKTLPTGAGSFTINGNLTLSGTATATTTDDTVISGNLIVGDGTTFTAADFDLTVTGTTTVGSGASGTLAITSTGNTVRFTGLVTIGTGAVWNNSSNEPINFRGGVTNGGTFTAGSGVQTFDTNSQALTGNFSIPSITVTGVTLTNNNTLTVGTALSGNGGLTNAATGTLNIGGTSGITTLTATAVGNTVNYNGGTQTVHAGDYYNLTISGSGTKTWTLTAGRVVGGNLVIGSGTGLTMAGNFTLGVTGTTDVTGTFTLGGTSTKTFTGDVTLHAGGVWNETAVAAYSIAGNFTNNATTFTANTGVHTFSGAGKTISGSTTTSIPSVTISGTVQNDGVLTVSTALAGGGALTNGATGTLNYGGSGAIAPTLTASAVGNTVNYNRAGAQTVFVTPYDTLTLSGSGTKSIGGDIAVAAGLSITGTAKAGLATASNTANTLALGGINKVAGTWGSTSSAATYQNNTYFSGTGIVTVATGGVVPTFSGLTSPSGVYGTTVVLTGVISGAGPTYPVNGETSVSATIDGNTQSGTVTNGTGSFSISFNLGTIAASVTPYTVTYSYTGGENLLAAVDDTSTTFTVTKATPTLNVTNSPMPYNGSGQAATVGGSVAGVVSHILTGGASSQLNAGTYAVTANFAPTDSTNYANLTGASAGNFIISKANPTLFVTNSPVDYDGGTHAAAVSSPVAGVVSNILTGGAANQTNANTYAVTANFAPSDTSNYNNLVAASAGNFIINKINQAPLTVTGLPANANYGDAGITAGTSGGSGIGAVGYSAGASTACSIHAVTGAVTITSGAGTCDITADKAADTNYNVITSDPVSITIGMANQATLTVTGLPADATYGDTPTAGTAGGSGTGAVTFSHGASTGCTVDTNTGAVTITLATGDCSITATKAADANYNEAVSDPVSIILHKANQTVSSVIAQRGSATTAAVTNNASLTIAKPAGVVSGDLLIANLNEINSETPPIAPVGWTLIDQRTLDPGAADRYAAVFYKVAGGAEGANYTFTVPTGGTVTVIGGIIAFSGVDTSTPFDAALGTISVQPDQGTVSATAITTATANAAVVMLGQSAHGNRTFSGWSTVSPGALTEILDFSNNHPSIGAAWAVKAAAGSTGAGSATLSGSERNGGILLALKPATDTPSLVVTGLPTDANYQEAGITAGTAGGSGTGAVTFSAGASTACSVDENTGDVTITHGSGTCSITATKAADDNYNEITSLPVSITVHKIDPVLSVTNSPVEYDGNPHGAAVSGDVTGAVSHILTGGSASQLNVGSYAVTASFLPDDTTDYNTLTDAPVTGTFDINQVAETLYITNSPVTYDGTPQAAIVTDTVDGTVSDVQYDASPVVPTDAGTYSVTADFTPDDLINYVPLNDAPAGNFTIDPLAVNLTGTREYDGTTTANFGILTVANAAGGDTVTVASGSGTLASNAIGGPHAITDFGTLTLGGAEAADYTLTGATGSVTIVPSTDATLKLSSTVKDQPIDDLGTPNGTIGLETAGAVSITATQAADAVGAYVTLFDPTNAAATVDKVVKYASGTVTYPATFAGDTPYANEAITDQDFFIVEVTAADTVTTLYYNIVVTIAPYATAPSAIDLTAGTNPVGDVNNVAIPLPGDTDTTGWVTGWVTGTHDQIQFAVTDAGGTSTITIDGGAYTSGNDYTIPSASPLTIVVTTTEAGQTTAVRTFTVPVTAAPYATAPTPVTLTSGAVNGIAGSKITDVVIPAPGATDSTGAVTGWATGTSDTIKFIVTDNGAATSAITINTLPYTSGTDYTIPVATPLLTIVVTTTEGGKTDAVRTFTIPVEPYATAPTPIDLTVGGTNPVGGVTNVAIPLEGATDTTGAVTGWVAGTNNRIKFTVTDNGAATSVITINTLPYTSGTDYTIAAAAPLTVVVTTTEAGKTDAVRTFTIGVNGAAYATAPTPINLAVGGTNPVGGVTDVAIPAPGATNTTGAVTGWVAATHDKIKFTVTDNGAATSVITINTLPYTSGTDYTIAAAAPLTVVVTTTEAGKTPAVRTFTIGVTAAPPPATTVCGNGVCEAGETASSCSADCGGGGGGGGGGAGGANQGTTNPNTSTSSTPSELTGTATGNVTYTRPVMATNGMITTNTDGSKTATLTNDNATMTLIPNSGATVSVTIPPGTTVTGDSDWNGVISPPVVLSLSTVSSGDTLDGFPLSQTDVGAVLKIGAADNIQLNFNHDVTVQIPTSLPDGTVVVIQSEDGNTWTTLPNTATVLNGMITFTTSHFSYFAVYAPGTAGLVGEQYHFAAGQISFMDVRNHWSKKYVEKIAQLGIVSGKTKTRFAPDDQVTRAELVKMAVNAFKIAVPAKVTKRPFADVSITAWYAPYMQAAKDAGILTGAANTRISPDVALTRGETLKILLTAAKVKLTAVTTAVFKDVPASSAFAKYVAYAKDHAIVSGYANGLFKPLGRVTRAEAVKMLYVTMGLK